MTKKLFPLIAVILVFGTAAAYAQSASTGRTLVIPEGTTEITRSYNQDQLTSVTIPGSVRVIPELAFGVGSYFDRYLRTITSVTIGYGVREIGDFAFVNMMLTTITIPGSVTSIGVGAFAGNQLAGHLAIPNSVTSIGRGAFMNNQLTSVTLPNGITSIEGSNQYGAFYQNQLTSVTIPDSVTTIGEYAFASNKITSLTLGKNVTTIEERAFYGHLLTGSLVIPNSVTTIGEYAFSGYGEGTNVTSLTIGNNVTSIGRGAFSRLYNVTSVTIPASVRTIGYGAFYNNPITRVTFEGDGVRLMEYVPTDRTMSHYIEEGPFEGNFLQVYDGKRGTYVRGSDGNWVKLYASHQRIYANTNFHAEPSSNSRIIAPIREGETVIINYTPYVISPDTTGLVANTQTDNTGTTWYQAEYGGIVGWIREDSFSGGK